MCGIAGFSNIYIDNEEFILNNMLDQIRSRGPDENGITGSKSSFIGMNRLAIIDIKEGSQPMFSEDKKYSIVFNGEIYNYREINKMLSCNGVKIKTNSDTETILNSYLEWGPSFIKHLRGVFAFAILNHEDGSLFIARDRIGVKPLYFFEEQGKLIFGSEIKALLKNPYIEKSLNEEVVHEYFKLRYVPGPNTLFKKIKKFPPGNFMIWKNCNAKFENYWKLERNNNWGGSFQEAQDEFNFLFDESCRLRMLSEKPVGAFLSGGVDSSAIVNSITKQYDSDLKTFSIGFDWEGDEIKTAKETSKILGTNHHEIICKKSDAKYLPKIIWHLDEPLGDGIIIPMYLLAKEASKHVTVVQSGEGADEILGGYFTHKVLNLSNYYKKIIPYKIHKKLITKLLDKISAKKINKFFDYPADLGEKGKQKLINYLDILFTNSTEDWYKFIISLFDDNEIKYLINSQKVNFLNKEFSSNNYSLNYILALQFKNWLPDDILCKLDKITMANSLEGRVPFMDHKLVEFVFQLNKNQKLNFRGNKLILRKYLEKSKLSKISRQKKAPFYIPINSYLNSSPLKEMLEELLSQQSVKKRNILNWDYIKKLKADYQNDGFLYGKQLFSVLIFELWCRIFIDEEGGWI